VTAGECDLDGGGRLWFGVEDDLDRNKAWSVSMALLELLSPGIKAGFAEAVSGAEGVDGETTPLPELDPASPLLFFGCIG
jgi:hypothetical protein